MNERDASETPPCPLHGSTDGVERARKVAQPWACSMCVLVFEGTTSEWERMALIREAVAENRGGGNRAG